MSTSFPANSALEVDNEDDEDDEDETDARDIQAITAVHFDNAETGPGPICELAKSYSTKKRLSSIIDRGSAQCMVAVRTRSPTHSGACSPNKHEQKLRVHHQATEVAGKNQFH